jgi:hypothetical protein
MIFYLIKGTPETRASQFYFTMDARLQPSGSVGFIFYNIDFGFSLV